MAQKLVSVATRSLRTGRDDLPWPRERVHSTCQPRRGAGRDGQQDSRRYKSQSYTTPSGTLCA